MKHWNLDIIGYWELEQVTKLKRTWNLAPVLQNIQMTPENYYPCLYALVDHIW